MQHQLMEILVCPICKGDLKLTVESEEGDEIVSGELRCEACRETYPISDSIPNMLPKEQRS
ncbi:MAG: methytransferase partner Trm112 [Tepidiformaceae bacterium]